MLLSRLTPGQSTNNLSFLSAALLFSIALSPTAAQAISLKLTPEFQAVNLGDTVSVELKISGLGDGESPSLGAFDLSIHFDPSLLSLAEVSFGDSIVGNQLGISEGSSFSSFSQFVSLGSSILWISEVSLESVETLHDLQVDSFTLATLTFETFDNGIASIDLGEVLLADSYGKHLYATTVHSSAEVLISQKLTPVPKPTPDFSSPVLGFGLVLGTILKSIRSRKTSK